MVLAASPASANDKSLYDRLWPQVPDAHRLTLSEQIQQQLTELGNTVGHHLDVLSLETITMRVDARRRRAFMAVGGGSERHLTLRLASDIQFVEGLARVNAKINLNFRGKRLELPLPEVEVAPASYRGERGVEVRLPLFRRRW